MSLSASIIGSMILANASSGITPSIVTSRPDDGVSNPSMWVAPCLVAFDALATTDSETVDSFGELLYSWDFGDYAKANEYWAYGARPNTQSKNRDLEPVAAHVYDTPGTYYVTLTVTNTQGKVNAIRQQIVVTDPNVVFAGAGTYCFSTSGDFAGAPPDVPLGNKIATNDLAAAINTYAATGKRLMFRAGETFTAATIPTIEDKNNGQITRFGSGADPILHATAGTVTETLKFWEHFISVDNWQVFGLSFTNPNNYTGSTAVSAVLQNNSTNTINGTTGRILCYQNSAQNLGGYMLNGYGVGVVECSVAGMASNAGRLGIWGQNVSMAAYLGNDIDNMNMGEHNARIQGGRQYVFAHNKFSNPSAAKHCLTNRGSAILVTATTWTANTQKKPGDLIAPTVANGFVYIVSAVVSATQHSTGASEPVYPTTIGQTVTNGTITLRCEYTDTTPYYYISDYFCVHDNLFDVENVTGLVDFATAVHPQSTTGYEVIENFLWRRNRYTKNGSNGVQHSQVALYIQGSKGRVQNNIFDISAVNPYNCVGVQVMGSNTGGIPVPHDIIVENNTFYSSYASPTATNYAYGMNFTSALGTGMVARNNLMYGPLLKGQKMVVDATGSAVISNNSSDAQILSTNPFVSTNPVIADDFKLAVNSYAKAAGTPLNGAFQDYFQTARSRLANPDMGAIDHRS